MHSFREKIKSTLEKMKNRIISFFSSKNMRLNQIKAHFKNVKLKLFLRQKGFANSTENHKRIFSLSGFANSNKIQKLFFQFHET